MGLCAFLFTTDFLNVDVLLGSSVGGRVEFAEILIMAEYMSSHCHSWPLFLASNQGDASKAFHNADFSSTHFSKNYHSANVGYSVT